jgi:membrane protease YdiL (CAAX protease family)
MQIDVAAGTSRRMLALVALVLLVPAPTIGVLCAMLWEPTRGTVLGQFIYGAAKVWILALPLAWRLWVDRRPISWSPLRRGGLGAGLLSGVAIAVCIVAGYWLIGRRLVDTQLLKDVAGRNGLTSLPSYLLVITYLALVNSLLEEYVWRWFVYRQCERLMPWANGWLAVVISAMLFTLHHVIALQVQFGWAVTVLGSAGIFIGGVTWSWLYRRYRSIWPGYVSHICADVAAFAIGWWLLFGR